MVEHGYATPVLKQGQGRDFLALAFPVLPCSLACCQLYSPAGCSTLG